MDTALTLRDQLAPPAPTDQPAPGATEVLTDIATVIDGKPLVRYSATEAKLGDLRRQYEGASWDLTTTKGDKDARAARLACVTLRTSLEKQRKAFKAPALEFGRLIDAEAKRITEEVERLEAPIDAAIRADEQRREAERQARAAAEAARVAELQGRITKIRSYVAARAGRPSEQIAGALAVVEGITIGDDMAELADEARQALAETIAAIKGLHDAAVQREAESARLEQQRREAAELEARLAAMRAEEQRLQREAEERAAAERAERERQEQAQAPAPAPIAPAAAHAAPAPTPAPATPAAATAPQRSGPPQWTALQAAIDDLRPALALAAMPDDVARLDAALADMARFLATN